MLLSRRSRRRSCTTPEITSVPPTPKTAKQLVARRNQERVKSILLLAIPDEYLLKFHNFENFSTTSNESLDKAYDRFQKLISQLEVHGAPISKEDINQKFLRSLPSLWNQIALIMRNKPDIDEVDIDDLYNNHWVYEDELKRSSGSNSASQNLAFLSSENTGGTNEVNTTSGDFRVSTAGGINQMDGDDLEELDLRWQVAMLTVRVKKFSKKNDLFLLISQRLSATTVTEKGILLENADLEGIKGEDLMGEYSQWRKRFMNYLEEQTDGEAMINSIQNGDHPLPVIAQVSLVGTAPNAPPTLKDP
ncbi:hypothetical protein Tco_0432367, partial [Tanacetum coccineum]